MGRDSLLEMDSPLEIKLLVTKDTKIVTNGIIKWRNVNKILILETLCLAASDTVPFTSLVLLIYIYEMSIFLIS